MKVSLLIIFAFAWLSCSVHAQQILENTNFAQLKNSKTMDAQVRFATCEPSCKPGRFSKRK